MFTVPASLYVSVARVVVSCTSLNSMALFEPPCKNPKFLIGLGAWVIVELAVESNHWRY